MKRDAWWNPRLDTISGAATIFVIHAFLLFILARYDIVSSIFAMGAHVPIWMFVGTVIFVAVRLALLLLVPVMLAGRGAVLLLRVMEKRRGT